MVRASYGHLDFLGSTLLKSTTLYRLLTVGRAYARQIQCRCICLFVRIKLLEQCCIPVPILVENASAELLVGLCPCEV